MDIKRGDIWVAKFSGTGSEQSGTRPAIVISNEQNNRFSPTVNVIPLTTQVKNEIPVHVRLGAECGLYQNSIALVEQEVTLDKSKLNHKIGFCNDDVMRKIKRAILVQKGYIRPFADKKYLDRLTGRINDIDLFINKCRMLGKNYEEDLMEKSFVIADIITYCREYNIDFNKYIPNGTCSERRMKLREVL